MSKCPICDIPGINIDYPIIDTITGLTFCHDCYKKVNRFKGRLVNLDTISTWFIAIGIVRDSHITKSKVIGNLKTMFDDTTNEVNILV